MSSLFTSTLAENFRRRGASAAKSSSSPATRASTCSSGARVPHPGQRKTGSLWRSETSIEKDSSHFWHWNSSCMSGPSGASRWVLSIVTGCPRGRGVLVLLRICRGADVPGLYARDCFRYVARPRQEPQDAQPSAAGAEERKRDLHLQRTPQRSGTAHHPVHRRRRHGSGHLARIA